MLVKEMDHFLSKLEHKLLLEEDRFNPVADWMERETTSWPNPKTSTANPLHPS